MGQIIGISVFEGIDVEDSLDYTYVVCAFTSL